MPFGVCKSALISTYELHVIGVQYPSTFGMVTVNDKLAESVAYYQPEAIFAA